MKLRPKIKGKLMFKGSCMFKLKTIFLLALVVLTSCSFFARGTKMIPREILFGNPTHTLPQVSPEGSKIAYLAPVNNVLNVWLKTVGKNDDKPITKDTSQGIQYFCWAQNSQQIIEIWIRRIFRNLIPNGHNIFLHFLN